MIDASLPNTRRLLLGLTGGVAAYKAAELARLLIHDGMDVQAVMTESACHFVGTATLQALTGKPVFTDLWGTGVAGSQAIGLSSSETTLAAGASLSVHITGLTTGSSQAGTLSTEQDATRFAAAVPHGRAGSFVPGAEIVRATTAT